MSEAADGLKFIEDDAVVIFNTEGEEVGRYQRAKNYFKAIKARLSTVDSPLDFVELNSVGANFFVSKDESMMNLWEECMKTAQNMELEGMTNKDDV